MKLTHATRTVDDQLYLTGVILLLAGIFIGATFKTGVDDRFFQLLGGTTAALSFY